MVGRRGASTRARTTRAGVAGAITIAVAVAVSYAGIAVLLLLLLSLFGRRDDGEDDDAS